MKVEADQNLIVYFDGRYMPMRDARVGILTHALHYGTGVFEGLRAYWNETQQELFVFQANEHYERWIQNCGILRIHVPLSPEELTAITLEILRRNAFRTLSTFGLWPISLPSVSESASTIRARLPLPRCRSANTCRQTGAFTRASVPGGALRTTPSRPAPRSAAPMSTVPWPARMRA
jgi:branched-subunit amino acid aminotransferase/4-amino-4-deoxychorismate lyase